MKQQIQLSDHFTNSRLLRFTLPSICMMIFTSIYGMVDGFFISNFVGKTAFASVNLIIPLLQVLGGVGAMLGVGGSALVATEAMMSDVMTYGTICLVFNTALQAQYTFQSYLVTAEKPKMALEVVIAAGLW